MQAAKDMAVVSVVIEAQVADALPPDGRGSRGTPAQMAPRDEVGGQASGACGPVSAAIDAIFLQDALVGVTLTQPDCEPSGARCSGSCNVELTPEDIVVYCVSPRGSPATRQGRCYGPCDGRCTGQCWGGGLRRRRAGPLRGEQCDGKCDGGCDDTCHRALRGTWRAPQCSWIEWPPSGDAEWARRAACAYAAVHAAPARPRWSRRAWCRAARWPRGSRRRWQANPAGIAARPEGARPPAPRRRPGGGPGRRRAPAARGRRGARALACVAGAAEASKSASVRIQVSLRASSSVAGQVGFGLPDEWIAGLPRWSARARCAARAPASPDRRAPAARARAGNDVLVAAPGARSGAARASPAWMAWTAQRPSDYPRAPAGGSHDRSRRPLPRHVPRVAAQPRLGRHGSGGPARLAGKPGGHAPLARGGLNYLFKSLDLIPDGIEDLGFLDDAFVLRVAASFAAAESPELRDQAPALARLARDAELIAELLGGDYARLKGYVRSLEKARARGRTVDDILSDEQVRTSFMHEITGWASSYTAPSFSRDAKNLIKLKSFLSAKLPA